MRAEESGCQRWRERGAAEVGGIGGGREEEKEEREGQQSTERKESSE